VGERSRGARTDLAGARRAGEGTEPGEYPVDWGLVAELEKPQDASEGWHTTVGPLIQGTLADRLQWNFNPLLSRYWKGETPGTTDLAYQLQLKYRYRPTFEFGIQGFGQLGPWYHWSALDAQTDPSVQQTVSWHA